MSRSAHALICAVALASCASPNATRSPAIPRATALCTDLACIEASHGDVIDLEGTFAFPTDPKVKGQHLYRVNLADGTSVILHAKERTRLTRDRDGQRVTVRGIVYAAKDLPDKYGIIQATSDPYCVEIFDVR